MVSPKEYLGGGQSCPGSRVEGWWQEPPPGTVEPLETWLPPQARPLCALGPSFIGRNQRWVPFLGLLVEGQGPQALLPCRPTYLMGGLAWGDRGRLKLGPALPEDPAAGAPPPPSTSASAPPLQPPAQSLGLTCQGPPLPWLVGNARRWVEDLALSRSSIKSSWCLHFIFFNS